MAKKLNFGIMYRREYPPEQLPEFARRVEELGFDELWVVEDCFYTSGIASAAVALASTSFLRVGLGIMPAVVRNPVFAAMEIATLARLYPGRFLPGFGHGVADWMRQIGAFPKSQLRALEEVTLTVRRLLAGEQVTFRGQHVGVEDARLILPPVQVPPVSLGVIGPKSLVMAGRTADGVILSEYSSPAYVTWAREQIAIGRSESGNPGEPRLSVFAFACAADSTAAARQRMQPWVRGALGSSEMDAKLIPMGIMNDVRRFREEGEQAADASVLDYWIDQLTIAGTPDDWSTAIERYAKLEIDSLVLTPLPNTGMEEIDHFAKNLSF